MRNRYLIAAEHSWIRPARTVAEYAIALGAALIASYIILQGRW
jgi:hypothetical protein